jgi:hypothetical protein
MQVFDVEPAHFIVGRATLEEALVAPLHEPLQSKSRIDTAELAGAALVAGRCDHSRWSLQFSNGRWLNVACGATDEVVWELAAAATMADVVAEPFALRYRGQQPHTIDSAAIVEARVGLKFSQLFANDSTLFLYIEHAPILWFTVIRNVQNKSRMLSVTETD